MRLLAFLLACPLVSLGAMAPLVPAPDGPAVPPVDCTAASCAEQILTFNADESGIDMTLDGIAPGFYNVVASDADDICTDRTASNYADPANSTCTCD